MVKHRSGLFYIFQLFEMRRLRYWFTTTIPKINYFYDIAVFPINDFVKTLHNDTPIQDGSSFEIPFCGSDTGIIANILYCLMNFLHKISCGQSPKCFLDIKCRIAKISFGTRIPFNLFHTASSSCISNSGNSMPSSSAIFLNTSSLVR